MFIVIIALAIIIVIGIIVIYIKQKRDAAKNKSSLKPLLKNGNQESLITVEDKYKEEYINRTSVDPNSVRGTIDLGLSDSLLEKEVTQQNLQTNLVKEEKNEQE